MSTTTEDIKARLSIVEVVGQYVRLQKAGAHYKANCPFHQEKTPSFMVNEERQMWHCFGCGKGGDVFAFVMEMEGLEFREALKLLAERAGVELPAYSKNHHQLAESKDRGLEILELATKFYEKQLWDSTRGKNILEYLRGRGLTDESIRAFRLGFAPDGWQYLSQFLLKSGYQVRELEAVGLSLPGKELGHYDRFRNRIMFPIMDILGRVVGYSARVVPGGDESQAKYINTPETALYHKSRALYGIHLAKQAIKKEDGVVLVEGNMDVIALHQAGIQNTVAVSGTALTPDQLSILKRYGRTIRLFFDMDEAGQAAAWKSTEMAFKAEFKVEIVALPFGKDAADIGKDDPEKLRVAVKGAKEAAAYFLKQLLKQHDRETAAGKRAIAEQMAELLSSMRNEIERSHWIKETATILAVEERVLVGIIADIIKQGQKVDKGISQTPLNQPLHQKIFQRRSETLREALVGLMLASAVAKKKVLECSGETRAFLEEHPLFFFLQNADQDPVALIEDKDLQREASQLLFETLALPNIANLREEERDLVLQNIAEDYLKQLTEELSGKDRLHNIARALSLAREQGNKEEERRLLAEFAKLSQQR